MEGLLPEAATRLCVEEEVIGPGVRQLIRRSTRTGGSVVRPQEANVANKTNARAGCGARLDRATACSELGSAGLRVSGSGSAVWECSARAAWC
jgi:hypothetical protein